MALVPLLRKLPTLMRKPQLFIHGIQRIGPKFNFPPSFWSKIEGIKQIKIRILGPPLGTKL